MIVRCKNIFIVLVEKYFIKKYFVLLKISCILRKNICYEVVVCPVPECSDPRQLCWLRRLSPDCPPQPGSDSGAAVHCTLILNTLYTLYLCWTPCTAARQSCTQLSTAAATPPPPPPNPSSSVWPRCTGLPRPQARAGFHNDGNTNHSDNQNYYLHI